jgi:hypothetical protein
MTTALAAADVIVLTDRLGAIWKRNLDVAAATAATDVSGTGMTDLVADVNSLAKNYQYGKAALDLQAAALAAKGLLAASDFATFLRALAGDLGGFTAYAAGQGGAFKYSEHFRDLCALANVQAPAALWVFKATNQTLATFAVTGATTGTFTGTGIVDTMLYGPLACELLITDDIGSSTTVTLTMLKRDGTTQSKTVNLTTSHHSGDTVAVGTGTDLYDDCNAIAVAGATSGDAFTVRAKVLRTPTI